MKKYVLACLLCCMSVPALATNNPEKLLEDYFKSWNSHNKSEITDFFAQDAVWYDLASDTQLKGKEKVAPAIINNFMGYVSNMYWHKTGDSYVANNTVIYEWVYGGVFNGAWGEKKIVNQGFSIKGISTTTFNAKGKVTVQKDYYDMDTFKRALGVSL